MAAIAVERKRLSLKDRLSRMTFVEACKLLGPNGKDFIQRNANAWTCSIAEDVSLDDKLFSVRFPGPVNDPTATVAVTLDPASRMGLRLRCDECVGVCDHMGAVFSLLLEEKTALGLAVPPPERKPVESLSEEDLVRQAVAERRQRAREERMIVESSNPREPWSDYSVANRTSGKSYRVTFQGFKAGDSVCNCPDFRTNTLGTCKHVLRVADSVKRRFGADRLKRKFRPSQLELRLNYVGEVSLRLQIPNKLDEAPAAVVAPLRDREIDDLPDLLKRLAKLQKLGCNVVVHPDADEFIEQRMAQARLKAATEAIRKDPANHPLRTTLLHVPLLPYQLDGVAFAAGAGRAVLADDMGLGKTIQGVAAAEFLAREADVRKVLVICPASLKSQWRNEIGRFCGRDVQLVAGASNGRSAQYANDCFFTICNYEQVLRDLPSVERANWDLIILDEGQRIKNWESKTSRTINGLRSRFALVLTGTPLENRLDDLFTIVKFVDGRRLGPGFRFFNRHRILDEKGKILGYKNLGELREALKPVLLRRTRESVKLELPPRTTEFVRIAPTEGELSVHHEHMRLVAGIVRKKFLTEMDLLRLQKELLMCRLSANGAFLVEKELPKTSSKLSRIDELFEQLFDEDGRKLVLFSEWTSMLDAIEPLLKKRRIPFVRLDGGVPQKDREELVRRFQSDAECAVFLTTNAGSVGLNLQSANTVVNVDLPWNPAVLEQRIARAHRMGQTQPVQVYVLVTEGTIEENLLGTIAAKKDLALAALDVNSDVDEVELRSGLLELKSRLEVLLGSPPEPGKSLDAEKPAPERRERVAAAGGELLGAFFNLLNELVPPSTSPPPKLVADLRAGLDAAVVDGEQPRLTIALPNRQALDQIAQSLARLLTASQAPAP